MKKLVAPLAAAISLVFGAGALAQLPSPEFQNITVGGLLNGNTPGHIQITGDCAASGTFSAAATCTKTNGTPFSAAATTAIGTIGPTIPLLNGANTWSAGQIFNSTAGATSSRLVLSPANGTAVTTNMPSATSSTLFESILVNGRAASSGAAVHYFGTSDTSSSGNLDNFVIQFSSGGAGTSFTGNRNTVHAVNQVMSATAAGQTNAQAAFLGEVFNSAGPTAFGNGYGGLTTPGAYGTEFFGANTNTRLAGATNLNGVWSFEGDLLIPSTSSVGTKTGIQVTQLPGSGAQGILTDTAFSIVNQDNGSAMWLCGFCVGGSVASWAMDPNYGVMYGAVPRLYSGVETQGTQFGLDIRVVTGAAGGDAIALANAAIGWDGKAYLTEVDTAAVVRAQTAVVASLTPLPDPDGIAGGLYTAIPTITIAVPPAGGANATATVATMGLGKIVGFGGTGSAYTLNDVLTIVGGSFSSAATIRATGVDGNGSITACAIVSGGTYTGSYPTKSPQEVNYPTGGSGTLAGFMLRYGAGAVTGCAPGVTGKGYVIGDILGTGGSPTPGALTVDTVDTHGGILVAHATTVGSVTTLPAEPFGVSGGSGSQASLLLGFKVLTTTITNAGGPYLNFPPLAFGSQTLYRTARFAVAMTPSEAALSLNPSGQPVTIGGNLRTAGISTVSGLPACNAGALGLRSVVSDATAPTYLGALTGGGTITAPVFCTGSAGWVSD